MGTHPNSPHCICITHFLQREKSVQSNGKAKGKELRLRLFRPTPKAVAPGRESRRENRLWRFYERMRREMARIGRARKRTFPSKGGRRCGKIRTRNGRLRTS